MCSFSSCFARSPPTPPPPAPSASTPPASNPLLERRAPPPSPPQNGTPPPAARRAAPPPSGSVPVTHAFDLKRRQDAIKRAQEIERAKASAGPEKDEQAPPKPASVKKVDRNDPCPCGSGKKYKKCHGVSPGDQDG